MLLITIIFNLSKHFCIICKFQYVACYNYYHQSHLYYIKNNKGPNT